MSANDALRLAAFGFRVDLVTAEVTTQLREAGIPSILLKGPALATWLYAGDESRLYGDTDLLLRGSDWEAAIAVLRRLRFVDDLGPLAHPRMESGAGHPWTRPVDGAAVDLHRTLFGIGADPEEVWTAFAADAVGQRVGGAEVALPSHPARLLHVALHAVQHGGVPGTKAIADLERAVAIVPVPTWQAARELADRLDAAASFAAGLQLTPGGDELAAAIGARPAGSASSRLRLDGVPTAEGFHELSQTRGLGAKLALLRRELFPAPEFMRWWSPLARRGRRGLLAAYGWRLVWLALRAGPGLRAWRRAARAEAPDR